MLVSSNITMQFGSKPLFENISVKFTPGNRYGLIGANGCGKSTFMKISSFSNRERSTNPRSHLGFGLCLFSHTGSLVDLKDQELRKDDRTWIKMSNRV